MISLTLDISASTSVSSFLQARSVTWSRFLKYRFWASLIEETRKKNSLAFMLTDFLMLDVYVTILELPDLQLSRAPVDV